MDVVITVTNRLRNRGFSSFHLFCLLLNRLMMMTFFAGFYVFFVLA
jgi:hypothetical protein